jgi:O-antigen/teichoic acid export membrane protein/2-polyprenyl-3-methyl-5-hydroxy-6-metoxy-1,4-benzoquinol methylase
MVGDVYRVGPASGHVRSGVGFRSVFLRSLFGSSFGSFGVPAARATGVVLGLATSVVLARGLGEQGRGELAVLVAWAGLVTQFGTLGAASSLAYFVALHPQHAAGLLRRSLGTCLLGMSAVAGLLALLSPTGVGDGLSAVGWVGLAAVGLVAATSVALLLAQSVALGLARLALFGWSDVAARFVSAIMFLGFLAAGIQSAECAAIAMSAGSLTVAAWVLRAVGGVRHAADARLPVPATEELRYGLKAWVACALFSLITRVVIIALADTDDEATVASFVVALGIVETVAAVASTAAQSRIAHMVRVGRSGDAARRELMRSIATTLAISVPAAIALSLASPMLMPFLYGDEFAASADALRIMSAWMVAMPVASVFQTMLAAQGMPWFAVVAPGIANIAVLIGVAAGFAKGLEGAALVVSASSLFFLASSVAAWWRHRDDSGGLDAGTERRLDRVDPMPPENAYGSRSRVSWVRDRLVTGMSVAELGCGTGLMLTAPLHRLGVSITGWDVHEPSIMYGRDWLSARGINPLILRCEPFSHAPDSSFDVVIASEVLEHLDDAGLRECLGTIHAKLRVNGLLLVTVPNGCGWFECDQRVHSRLIAPVDGRLGVFKAVNGIKQVFFGDQIVPAFPSTMADEVSPHLQWFSRGGITSRLEAAGFSVESFEGSTLLSGPIADLLITGVPPLMWLNSRVGRQARGLASGFRIVARKRCRHGVHQ